MDLTQYDMVSKGIVMLKGEWEFYWKQFIAPESFVNRASTNNIQYFTVPQCWNGFLLDDERLPGNGYATFRLRVSLAAAYKKIYIHIPDIYTAYKLWVNGRLISSCGKIGKNKDETIPMFIQHVVDFYPDGTQLDIIFQISNFHHRKGGLKICPRMGLEKHLKWMVTFPFFLNAMIFGCLCIMSLYHLILYMLRSKEKMYLYFGIFCLLIAMRIVIIEYRMATQIFSGLSWCILQKLEYIFLYLSLPLFCLFFYTMFPKEIHRKFYESSFLIIMILCLIVCTTPVRIFSNTTLIFQGILIGYILYSLIPLKRILQKKRQGSVLFFLGFVCMFMTIINDVCYFNQILYSRQLIHIGVFLFLIFYAIYISKRFAAAFVKIDSISGELKKKNKEIKKIKNLIKESDSLAQKIENDKVIKIQDESPALVTKLACERSVRDENAIRELMVQTMCFSIKCWEIYSGKTKIDLAEESKLWKATLDGSSYKTRTLDKYLRQETLPKRPRWREIISTANYVLTHCNFPDDHRNKLNTLVSRLESMLMK
jgi:hypothetical protein